MRPGENMRRVERQAFAPHGPLALSPLAFGVSFLEIDEPQTEMRDGVAIVTVSGPTMNRRDPFFDSYESLRERVSEAAAKSPRAIVLNLDSPGGLVAGLFETVDALRKISAKTRVPLLAYVGSQATSAAYALACAASQITCAPTATIGSIGIIDSLIDESAAQRAAGLQVTLIKSGSRKVDTHGGQLSDDAVIAAKDRVMASAEVFFRLVATARGMAVEDVRAQEAGLLVGAQALSARLVDRIGTLDDVIAAIGAAPAATEKPMAEEKKESNPTDEAIAALRKAAEGDDENASKAKKMLAALDEEPDGDEGEAKAEDDGDGAPPPKKDEKKSDGESQALAAAARAEASERSVLMASRPDFTKEQRATLAKAPIEVVRDAVATWSKAAAVAKPAAAAQVTGTRGEGQGEAPRSPEANALAARMGLVEATDVRPRMQGVYQVLPAMTRAQGRAELQRRAAVEQQKRQQAASR
jgi:signal peptide peptidase SppA